MLHREQRRVDVKKAIKDFYLSERHFLMSVVQKHDDKNRENFVFERKEVTDCFDTHKLIFHITSYFLAYYKRNIVTIPTPKQNLS